jgi:hypothetical protein
MARTVTGLYDNFAAAQQAVQDLVDAGFARDNISLVANDAAGTYQNSTTTTAREDVRGNEGASFGAVTGALVGLGAMLIPGIGPVVAAGPLIAALTGAGIGAAAGAVTGGITASLVNFGFTEETAGYYAEGVRRGGTLVVVHADENRAAMAENILNRHGIVDVTARASDWQSSGWSGFDETRDAYTAEEIEAERQRYLNN